MGFEKMEGVFGEWNKFLTIWVLNLKIFMPFWLKWTEFGNEVGLGSYLVLLPFVVCFRGLE